MKEKTAALVGILLGVFWQVHGLWSNPQEQKELSLTPSEDEVSALNHLIGTTEQRLVEQKQLKELMIKFKEQKDQFIEGKASKKDAYQMVKTASEVLRIINDSHLQYLFSPLYLEELTVFSSIAGKNTPVRP